jgi:hypothetical protein
MSVPSLSSTSKAPPQAIAVVAYPLQFIFTTHNANVAVGADAELSHVLEATADKGTIKASGGIDHQGTNELLLLHLEGGSEALKLRVRKYEL